MAQFLFSHYFPTLWLTAYLTPSLSSSLFVHGTTSAFCFVSLSFSLWILRLSADHRALGKSPSTMPAYHHNLPHLMSPTPHRYQGNGHTNLGYALASGKSCQNCANTSIILEALFNRIHILEAQLSQVFADKEVAHQTLYRLVGVQAIARHAGIETPSNSGTLGHSAGGNSLAGSPECKAARSREREALSNEDTPLIDLLGSIEQQPVNALKHVEPSPKKGYQALLNYDSSDEEKKLASIGPEEEIDMGHVRRFSDKTLELNGQNTLAGARIKDSSAQGSNETSTKLAKRTIVSVDSSSNDDDSEGSMMLTSLNTSFSSQNTLVDGVLATHEYTDQKPTTPLLVGLQHSRWAPKPVRGLPTPSNDRKELHPEKLSPEQRWEKYCDNIAVKCPRRSCDELEFFESIPAHAVDINNDEILAQEGQAAKLNRFRYLNVCGLCFNPRDEEQGVYRTVIISKLSKQCTMTDLLSKIRGGMILDAKMLNTFAITKYKSAMLTFVEGSTAVDLEEHAKQHPLSIAGHTVEVSLVEVPTRPISFRLKLDISNNHCTRCLHVRNFPRHIAPLELRLSLRPLIGSKLDFVESMAMNAEGVLELRFLSIMAAQEAFALLSSKSKYQKCLITYAADPCAQPWKSAETAKGTDVSQPGTQKEEADGSLAKPDEA